MADLTRIDPNTNTTIAGAGIRTTQDMINKIGGSPTVLTDANIRESTIPNITARAGNYTAQNNSATNTNQATTGNTNTGSGTNTGTGDGTDYSKMSYEDIYKNALGGLNNQPLDPTVEAELNLIKGTSANQDAVTKASIDAIQQQYSARLADTQLQQKSTTAGLEQTLNLGGSSRYAPVSSSGILSSKEKFDLQTLNDLTSSENTQIATLRQAQADKDYKAMSDQLSILDKTRSDKIALAGKIADNMASVNKDTRDKLQMAQADAAKLAAQNGAPKAVIDAINNAKSPSEAYSAAAGYGGGGNIDVQKITNVDGSQSIVRIDKNTGKIVGTTNIGGGTPLGSGSVLSPTDYKDFITGLTPEGVSNFNKLNAADQSDVKQLINGDALLSDLYKSRGQASGTLSRRALQLAQAVDSTFSENTNKIRYSFKQNWDNDATKGNVGVRTAINTGLGHLADFKQNTDALDNEAVKSINSTTNWWNMQTNNSSLLKAQTDVTALAGEIAKAYNEDTVSGIDKWSKVLGLDYSKGGITSVENEVSKLLTSKITSLRYTYKTAMGKDYSQSVVDPDKKQALLDAGIDPKNIAKENIPGEPKMGVAAYIETARNSADPVTHQKYTSADIVNHMKSDPKYADGINAVLGKPDSSGHIINEDDILNYLSQ